MEALILMIIAALVKSYFDSRDAKKKHAQKIERQKSGSGKRPVVQAKGLATAKPVNKPPEKQSFFEQMAAALKELEKEIAAEMQPTTAQKPATSQSKPVKAVITGDNEEDTISDEHRTHGRRADRKAVVQSSIAGRSQERTVVTSSLKNRQTGTIRRNIVNEAVAVEGYTANVATTLDVSADEIVKGIIWAEILGKPKALR